MTAYLSIIRMRFIALLQYRIAAAAGIFTQLFFGFVMVVVIRQFFFSGDSQAAMSMAQAVTYIWLGQAMLGMMPWNGDNEVITMIKDGNIAYELCRPLNIYTHWYCRLLALRTAPTLLRCLPIFLIAGLLPVGYNLQPPPSPAAFAAWLAAILGSLLLGCALSNIISISALWTVAGEGMLRMLPALVIFFSGSLVPLPLFPSWAQGIVNFLPFAGLVDVPNQFFIGTLAPAALPLMLLRQLAWTAVFGLIGAALLRLATKRVVIQGG